ncbi:MAG: undecaprenyl-diphosphatase, partial [Lysinibacillus sp.]
YPILNPAMIFIAEYMAYFLVLGVFTIWFIRGNNNRMMVVCGMITLVAAEIFGKIAGSLYSNNQPFAELENVSKLIEKAVNNSFPSDHTILFFSLCMSFWLFKRGSWGILAVALACLVGISRIWVGVHYPADILAAAIISIITATVVYRVIPKLSITHKLLAFFQKSDQLFLAAVVKPKKIKSEDS